MAVGLLGRHGHGHGHSKSPSQNTPSPAEDIDDIDEVDGEGQNIILSLIGQLRAGADLSRITLPTFILERKSMLERITNQLQHPYILNEAHATKDPVDRFVQVVKWYLSGWHIAPKAVKKPLNPVLGEHFTCYWDNDDNTRSYYIAEQTSHHPPKSSYFYIWPEHHIRIDGTLVPKSRFLGNSAASIMEGVGFLKFLDIKSPNGEAEEYEITQPNMYARGVLIGTLKFELGDFAVIKCKDNDLICNIEFKTKGFISGTYNAIHGEIKKISTGKVLYEITGKWNEVLEIKNLSTGHKSVFFDAATAKKSPPKVRPIAEQGPLESRRLWEKVTNALGARDHTVATDEKFFIEDRQRAEARKREEDGVEFHPKLFKHVDNSPLEYVIYKDIDPLDVKKQTEQVFSIAPILPGQQFHEHFSIPAFKKNPHDTVAATATSTASAPAPGATPTPSGGLNDVSGLKSALPKTSSGTSAASVSGESDDEFVDAES
ncbi:oxysterol-binding protein related protein OSH7 [Sugiyamaella lignohabitans]|uniref:Oxysterol-binding protein related protein OSH7 n=1 Tax=Sugiyamaella lignohabitans TaxID=796027 RepID=A0A167DFA8_9ASCO|nr:oxysterol-binding protein related protein OSH7 [Sugiyamaella lignohabitans]ANB12852.1 oxysterol-binding protein related protein OSH7 [Sugiyamaella lignohabitans]